MALKVKPIRKKFHLARLDQMYDNEGEPTYVEIRQATVQDANGIQWDPELPLSTLFEDQIYCTLCDANLEDEDGEPYFDFKNGELAMTKNQFKKAFQKMPQEIGLEIHAAVLEINTQWGDSLAQEGEIVEMPGGD